MRCSAKIPVEGAGRRRGELPPGPLYSEWTQSLSVGCLHSFGSGEKKDEWVAGRQMGSKHLTRAATSEGRFPIIDLPASS